MEIEIAHQYRHHTSNNNNAADVEIGGGACLAWEDLTAVLPNFGDGPTKRLINGLTGYALPGRILAVMGPSGSGKSTFLDSLTGRLAGNVVMSGNIILNGKKQSLHYGLVAYVTQEDELLGTLTVRETIKYSALLRLPSNLTKHEINDIVDQTITDMGLEDCADTLIGNWHLRGISGGEKKRLSIALEMITQPYLLFLDEPTSGLDSASAFFVIQGLKNVAASGRTIISTVHQPSSEVFALFDDLLLLSLGETVYFGDAKMALEFFADAGFPCPGRRSPSDHFLRCVNSDFDELNTVLRGSLRLRDKEDANGAKINSTTTTEIRIRLIQKYHTTKLAARAKSKVQGFSTTEGFILDKTGGSRATWTKQLWTLTKRSFKNMYRDFGYYWLRIIVYIIVSLCTGSVFYNVGSSFRAVYARGAAGGFISGFMTMMSIGGFPSFVEEMKIFHKERRNGHYGVGLYILSNIISSFPFIAIMSFSTAAITYFMVKFHPGFFHFFYVSLVLLLSISVVESCMMVIASLVPNYLMGVVIGAGFIGTMMASAGFFRSIPLLPKVFWTYPVSYLNYMAWALQGAYKNDMIGLEFESEHPGEPKLKGEDILNKYLGVSLKHSKWWDLAVVACILIAYRLIFFLILKLKERALPMLQTFYANVTLHQMKKRPSFRKTTSPFPSFRKTSPFPSLRHQVAYPLSSQEGLNSPLH